MALQSRALFDPIQNQPKTARTMAPVSPEATLIQRQNFIQAGFLSKQHQCGIGKVHRRVCIFTHQSGGRAKLLRGKAIPNDNLGVIEKLHQYLCAPRLPADEMHGFGHHSSRGQQGSGKCGQDPGTTFMLRVAPVKGRHQGAGIEQPRSHDRVFIRSRCSRHGSLPWGTGEKSRRPKWRPARSPTVPGRSSCPAINSRTSSDSVRPEAAARARNAFRWAAGKRMVSVSDMSETLSIVRHSARHNGSRNSSRGICPRHALPREVRSISPSRLLGFA